MTDEAIRGNVRDELALADSALHAAEALLDLGLPADAASRTYYAALHAARALLFAVGLDVGSHRAVRTHLSRHYVKTGRLAADQSKRLAQLEAVRVSADYDPAFALGVAEVAPELVVARSFVDAARTILSADGWV